MSISPSQYSKELISRFSDEGFTEEYLRTVPHRILSYGEDAGCFIEVAPGRWEGHYLCKNRGKTAFTAAKNVIEKMFSYEDVSILTGLISISNKPARLFTRKLGFSSLGEVTYPDGDYELFILKRIPNG